MYTTNSVKEVKTERVLYYFLPGKWYARGVFHVLCVFFCINYYCRFVTSIFVADYIANGVYRHILTVKTGFCHSSVAPSDPQGFIATKWLFHPYISFGMLSLMKAKRSKSSLKTSSAQNVRNFTQNESTNWFLNVKIYWK